MDDLDRRLGAADPARPVAPHVLDALSAEAHREGRFSRRRRLTIIGLSSLLVIGGGAVAAPAAADVVRAFLAQADWFPAAGGEVLADSEWVDTSQRDLRAYLDTVYPVWLELAPGQDREGILDAVAADSAANPGLTQEVSLRRMIETRAYCGWAVELADAHAAGDERRYDAAAAAVLSAADWPAIVATDGGGIADRLHEVGSAAVDGEHGAWLHVYAAGDCDILGFPAGAR